MAAANEALEKLFQKARQSIADRDWVKAKHVYLQALGIRADNPDVHYGLATVYFQLRELPSAAHHFQESTRLDPLRAGAFINLGAVQNLMEDYEAAVVTLRRGLHLDPTRGEGFYNLGVVYKNLGEEDLAIQAYRDALRLNPRAKDAHLNLANLLLLHADYRQALHHYEKALQLRPKWDKALEGIAQAKEGLKSGTSAGSDAEMEARPLASPHRRADPETHGSFLTHLHQATVETEESAQTLHRLLEREIAPAVKFLASALLQPNRLGTELDDCVEKFEAALEHMRTTYQQMQNRVAHLIKLEDQFPVK